MTPQWRYPKLCQSVKPLDITDEMLKEYEKELNECNEYNKNLKSYLNELRTKIIANATHIWGEKSNEVKYLRKCHIWSPQTFDIDGTRSTVMKAREAEKIRIQEIERQQKHTELIGKAIKFLTDKGKIINVDFTVDTAIAQANDIAYEEAISKKQKELSETQTFVDFNGSDNCENCAGWDGSSRRCQCGNRRVSWQRYDNEDFFLEPHIYGEAY